jgi:hypothetical protein
MLDGARGQIHWVRCSATDYPRAVEWFGTYGGNSVLDKQLWAPRAMAVSSGADIYDDIDDYIYVADRMFHRLRVYKFDFDPSNPGSDHLEFQFNIEIDPKFYPNDINYIDYHTGYIYDNVLVVLDDMGERLFVFSHEGVELFRYSTSTLDQEPYGLYCSITSRLDQFGNIYVYIADYVHADIDLVKISVNGDLDFLNTISIGGNINTVLTDVIYSERFGLLAVERKGPHIYQIAPDLSRIIGEVVEENFNPAQMFDIMKIIIHPERLIVLENLTRKNGILSFASILRSPKKTIDIKSFPYRSR